MGEYSYDGQGHICVGPKASQYLMEVIYCSTTCHKGAENVLALFC